MEEETINAWIARDKDGILDIYTSYPTRKDDLWVGKMLLDSDNKSGIFSNIDWNDKFATHVEITIKIVQQ